MAVVIDVYSRKVVGWAFSEQMTSDLVIAALNVAITARRPSSVIHQLAVFTWIESWYNPLHRHSGINYKSPNNFGKALNDEEIKSNQQTPKSFPEEAQTVRSIGATSTSVGRIAEVNNRGLAMTQLALCVPVTDGHTVSNQLEKGLVVLDERSGTVVMRQL